MGLSFVLVLASARSYCAWIQGVPRLYTTYITRLVPAVLSAERCCFAPVAFVFPAVRPSLSCSFVCTLVALALIALRANRRSRVVSLLSLFFAQVYAPYQSPPYC